jgi:hypothetical protein
MAHFVQIDSNNMVVQVIVIDNKDTVDYYGTEREYIGAEFCEYGFGGTWKQTSYNGNMRKNFAGVGYIYREDIDAFVAPQPYQSWTLDADAKWQPPTPIPTDGKMYSWNEVTQAWVI